MKYRVFVDGDELMQGDYLDAVTLYLASVRRQAAARAVVAGRSYEPELLYDVDSDGFEHVADWRQQMQLLGRFSTVSVDMVLALIAQYGGNGRALARALGVHPNTITRWRKGQRTMDRVSWLAALQTLGFPGRGVQPGGSEALDPHEVQSRTVERVTTTVRRPQSTGVHTS